MNGFVSALARPVATGWRCVSRLRQLTRFALIMSWIALGFLLFFVLRVVQPWRPFERSLQPFLSPWMRVACVLIGVRISRSGAWPPAGSLLLCNHISWLDIVVIAAMQPVRFVAKIEVRRWTVIGLLAASAGTLFLHRGRREGDGSSEHIIEQIQTAMQGGETVLVFPEGTTSDGHQLRRFHARLLHVNRRITPVALAYRGGGASAVPFIGEDNFASSLWRILAERDIHAHVQWLTALPASTPATQAREAQHAITAALDLQRRSHENTSSLSLR